jgi:hypothetical protein
MTKPLLFSLALLSLFSWGYTENYLPPVYAVTGPTNPSVPTPPPKSTPSPSKATPAATTTPKSTSPVSQKTSPQPATSSKKKSLLEVKGGYFFFVDKKMRQVYDEGGLDLQLCTSLPLWKWLQVYASVECLQRNGRSLNDHQKTSIIETPLSLGLKPVIVITPEIQYYLTLGARYFLVFAHNHSTYVDKTMSNGGLGGFVNTGFNLFPKPHIVVDFFFEYSYKRMSFYTPKTNVYTRTVQVGGCSFGVGLGYAF